LISDLLLWFALITISTVAAYAIWDWGATKLLPAIGSLWDAGSSS
jgi:hypothetical protein